MQAEREELLSCCLMLMRTCFLVFRGMGSFESHESMLLTLLRPEVLCPFSHRLLVSKPILSQPLRLARKPVSTLTNLVLISLFFSGTKYFPLLSSSAVNFNSFVFYPVWWKDFQVDLVYVTQLIYLSRHAWLCFPVDGEASWPNCFLVDAEGLFVPLSLHSTHLADWGLLSDCFQVPHASHRHVWFLHVRAYCFSLLGSPVATEAWDSLALCDTCDVLPRGCRWRDGRTTGSLWSRTQPEDCGLCHGRCPPGSQGPSHS